MQQLLLRETYYLSEVFLERSPRTPAVPSRRDMCYRDMCCRDMCCRDMCCRVNITLIGATSNRLRRLARLTHDVKL